MKQAIGAPNPRSRRRDRIALATWSSPASARITAHLRLDVEDLTTALPGIAPVAAVGWSIAQGLERFPNVNRRVAVHRVRANDSVRVSYAVSVSHDLQVAIIDAADKLTPNATQRALLRESRAAQSGNGPFAKATRLMSAFPVVVSRPTLRIWSLLTAGLGVPLLGFGAAPFGAALVSSVATFDLNAVEAPFVPFARCALVVSIGAARCEASVRDGLVEPRDVIDLVVTADHRICDGAQFASFTHCVLGLLGQSQTGPPRRG